jgi:PAS domain S-box-containing protein
VTEPEPAPAPLTPRERTAELFAENLATVHRDTDRVFTMLMGLQWAISIALALGRSPSGIDPDEVLAVTAGGGLTGLVVAMTRLRPGSVLTRHTVAAAQMSFSGLLIHLTGGRIETHFHIFGSLAFLAYYRDVRVMVTATMVVVAEHLLRGLVSPLSVYGIADPAWWRFFEHAVWVLFEDLVLTMGILATLREMRELARRQAFLENASATVEHTVITRTRDLHASREQYRQLIESVQITPYELEPVEHRVTYVGPQGAQLLGNTREAWLVPGFLADRINPGDAGALAFHLAAATITAGGHEAELRLRRDDGGCVWVRSIARGTSHGGRTVIRGVLIDVTERRHLELELQQAQKLESVGRLASGIAHEINTPVQFVADSVHFVRDAFADTMSAVRAYQGLRDACTAAAPANGEQLAAITHAEDAADLPYLEEHVPRALERCVDGLDRIATLVRSMKEFAHPDQREKVAADLNHALDTTLTIARNEYKYVADVVLDRGPLPSIACHVNELNQVFLNLIVNAAHAIADVVGDSGERGTITVTTRVDGEVAVVTIADTGGGIPAHVQARIFEPFFTTKAVGKGTGQGLAIARNVVVEKHGGSLDFVTRPGAGTTFVIRLPLQPAATAAAA